MTYLPTATVTPSKQSFSREPGRETAMAKDILGEAGLHFDELNKLRVLDPEVTQQTIELKEECKDFVDKIGQFQKIVGGLIELVDQLAKEAENEKMKAIGARNLLKSIAKQREAQQQQLQALIAEKKMQLERYRVEYEALCKVEAEQNEFIDQFIFQKWTEIFIIYSRKAKKHPKQTEKPLYHSSDLTDDKYVMAVHKEAVLPPGAPLGQLVNSAQPSLVAEAAQGLTSCILSTN